MTTRTASRSQVSTSSNSGHDRVFTPELRPVRRGHLIAPSGDVIRQVGGRFPIMTADERMEYAR